MTLWVNILRAQLGLEGDREARPRKAAVVAPRRLSRYMKTLEPRQPHLQVWC